MRHLRYVLLAALVLMCGHGTAQELTVKSVSLQPSDRTALDNPVIDVNGDTCGLVKIKCEGLEDLQFPFQKQYMGDVKLVDGAYCVYKSVSQSRNLTIQHPNYLPLQLDVKDYGYSKVKPGKTYLVVLEAPVVGVGQSIVALRVTPVTATVTLDGRVAQASSTGIYEFPVGEGTHNYVVEAPDYMPAHGSVAVGASETRTQSVRLQPITHEVEVKCNIGSSHVFVDNIDYGRVGSKLRLPQGRHQVRVQAEGYLDAEQTVDISAATQQLSYNLKKNENRVDIHATPVTIISSSRRIYKNNKQLKGWTSGQPIMFMPGTYMLSDDAGNEKRITVEANKPMTVRF